MRSERSIVIIGGGPSGLAAAIWAKRAAVAANVDLPVTIIEQRSRDSDYPAHGTQKPWGTRFNALSISPSSMNNLAALGVDFDNSVETTRWVHNKFHLPDGEATRFVTHRCAVPGKASQDSKGAWVLPQVANMRLGVLENRLLHTAENLGVEIVWMTKAIGFTDCPDGTMIEAVDKAGSSIDFPAWLCVVADGSSKAHQHAVLRANGNVEHSSSTGLIHQMGINIVPDSPDLGRFIAAPFRVRTKEPGLHVTVEEVNGLLMVVDSRFDMPSSSTMVQVRLPNNVDLSKSEKLGWLAWAASRHGVPDPLMLQEPVEFHISATHASRNVSRNRLAKSGISGAKLLIGMARASTSQTNGAGFQVTGLVDGYAIGVMLKRILARSKSERAALAHYETGRNNAAKMLVRRHNKDTPVFGLRGMRIEDYDRLVAKAQVLGFRGEQPELI